MAAASGQPCPVYRRLHGKGEAATDGPEAKVFLHMKVMLDTNICIYLIKQQPPTILERFLSHPVGDIGISSVTAAELAYGVTKSRHALA